MERQDGLDGRALEHRPVEASGPCQFALVRFFLARHGHVVGRDTAFLFVDRENLDRRSPELRLGDVFHPTARVLFVVRG